MNKKIIISTLLISILLFVSTLSFAADNTMLQDGVNSVRNVVGGMENTVEDAAQGAAGAIKGGTAGIENGLNTAVDNMNGNNNNGDNNNNNDNNNNYIAGTTNNNDNNGNYTATRTATFMGMTGNTWTWFIIGLVGIAIIALVWAYSVQENRTERNH